MNQDHFWMCIQTNLVSMWYWCGNGRVGSVHLGACLALKMVVLCITCVGASMGLSGVHLFKWGIMYAGFLGEEEL